MYSTFLFLHLQTAAASQCPEALKLLVGMVGGAGETNPTAAPWLIAVIWLHLNLLTPCFFTPALCHTLSFTPSTPRRAVEIFQVLQSFAHSHLPPSVFNEGKTSDPE